MHSLHWMQSSIFLNHHHAMATNQTHTQPPPLTLDPISQYRAWKALQIYFTTLLNRQLHRRFLLEQQAMHDLPVSQRFRPVILLEPVPTLHKPPPSLTNTCRSLSTLRARVHLLRARVEKGKELASEIERRMATPRITYPTHFCHTCVVDGESGGGIEVLLTTCGHRVCRTCLGFGAGEDGVYECSICFAPAQFVERVRARSPVTRTPDGVGRCPGREGQIASVSRKLVSASSGKGRKALVMPVVCPK